MNAIERAAAVRAQLERILVNPEFAPAIRLSAFLRFVVEEELAGRSSEIKEYVIGVNVYRKGDSYDPRTDPTVRVDAGKLRTRLAEYYESGGSDDPIVISIPKGTYVPKYDFQAFQPRPEVLPPEPPETQPTPPPTRKRSAAIPLTVGLLIALVACAVWIPRHLGNSAVAVPPPRVVAVSSEMGEPSEPSLSPDGSMLAFSWNGETPENFDIYVKVVNAPNAFRLTSDPAHDAMPAWSPDGRQIAFLRNRGTASEVIVVSALGGPERLVTTANTESLGWTADSQSLLLADRKSTGPFAGFVVSVETGERRQLTFPPSGSILGDYDLVASPDGRKIAFCRMVRGPVAELWWMPASGGKAEKLNESRRFIRGLAWTPDSRTIVYSSQQTGFSALWTLRPESPGIPALLPGLETDAVRPSIPLWPGRLDRIAYQRREQPYYLWRATIAGGKMSAPWSIIPSRRGDWFPQISPDGNWIAFSSDRAGHYDIWVSRLDGTGLRNLTPEGRLVAGSPRWSPDGSNIAFDGHEDGDSFDIYVIPAAGGLLRRITWEQSLEVRPSWSANGAWLYFTSDRTGRAEIWKVPSSGGTASQVTTTGGFECFESPDGRTLYFLDQAHPAGLWRMPSGGGEASLLSHGFHDGRWSVTETGIYFVDASRRICLLTESKVACVGVVDRDSGVTGGMSVSRDGKELVYVQPEPVRSILMMAEGSLFR